MLYGSPDPATAFSASSLLLPYSESGWGSVVSSSGSRHGSPGALSTALMVLGPEATRPLLGDFDASALFLVRRPEGLEEVDLNGFTAGGIS